MKGKKIDLFDPISTLYFILKDHDFWLLKKLDFFIEFKKEEASLYLPVSSNFSFKILKSGKEIFKTNTNTVVFSCSRCKFF